jgi:hypothetical protein
MFLHSVKIPILIQHGSEDPVVSEVLGQRAYRQLKDLGYSHNNTSTSDMMMMMMVMMGGFGGGGGGGGGFYAHGGFGGGWGGCGPAMPPINCCPPCKGW